MDNPKLFKILKESAETKIEVIKTDIGYIKRDISEIKESVKIFAGEHQDSVEGLNRRVGRLEKWYISMGAIGGFIVVLISLLSGIATMAKYLGIIK